MSENQYAPGIYVKGDVERDASSARGAVALVFEGFQPKSKVKVTPGYTGLDEDGNVIDGEPEEPITEPVIEPTPAPAPKPTNPKGNK